MKTAAGVVGGVVGITGLIQIVLGVLFWTGHALSLIQLHMAIGFVFVLAMWTLCVLAIRARLRPQSIAGVGQPVAVSLIEQRSC